MLKPLYIIPARGGSKGIPGKNIKPLAGRPLLAYTIDAAFKSGANCENLILSTDSEEIASVGREYGLSVDYMRPAELATDTAGSREVILDVMDWAERRGMTYDCVVLLQPTSPFRTADDIVGALELYEPELDMVVSVCEAASNPYYTCFETDGESGYLHISKGDGKFTRRQDAPKVWEYNGAVYVINPKSVRHQSLGEFQRRVAFVMPRERSVDLDTPTDWLIAETLMNNML